MLCVCRKSRAQETAGGGEIAQPRVAANERSASLDFGDLKVHGSFPMHQGPDEGQLHTLGLIEQLRAECGTLWGTSSQLYHRIDGLIRELADPNLHDIPTRPPFRIELWDRSDQHIRWVIAASSSVAIGHRRRDCQLSRPALQAAQWHPGHSRAPSEGRALPLGPPAAISTGP